MGPGDDVGSGRRVAVGVGDGFGRDESEGKRNTCTRKLAAIIKAITR